MQGNSVNRRSVTALLPMRHSSQRIFGKNYRSFAGIPLYRHILDSLLAAENVARVVIDTDSGVIRDDCLSNYDNLDRIILLERPPELCAPEVPMNKILLHDLQFVEGDYFLQTHATNPLLKTETIDAAIEQFFNNFEKGRCDSLFSVTPRKQRIWDSHAKPINHDPEILLQTQDLEPYFEENSCLYLFSASVLMNKKNRIGDKPIMFEMDPLEAVDIDEEHDFLLAEAMYMYSQSK